MIGQQFQLQDYVNNVQELLHDVSSVTWPLSRVTSRINDARLDVALDMHCVRSFVTNVQLIPGQEAYVVDGAVCGANVTAGGSNYTGTTVPVTFTAAPMGGVTALGFGTLSGGSLASITMTQWGTGYTAVPTITIGGNGSGAAATAVTMFGMLNPISVTYIFNNIRNMLGFLAFSQFQAFMRVFATSTFISTPAKWTIHEQSRTVYIQPPPNQLYFSEWDFTAIPTTQLAQASDVDNQVRLPWARGVEFRAAELLLYKLQNAAQVRALGAAYDSMVPRIVAGAGGYRTLNPYSRVYQRMVSR